MSARKMGRPKLSDDSRWSDRELCDFATALQRFGFGDTKKISLFVKTKSENAVKALISLNVGRARRQMSGGVGGKRGRRSTFHSIRPKEGEAEGWPTLRKWQKIAQNQQMDCVRKVDYSPLVIPEIWDRFRDEAPTEDPQLVDTKAMYGFIAECIRGRTPPELPPKESATLLMLLKFVREMFLELDMKEEEQFVRDFLKATTFAPVEVKDEFKKKEKKASVVCPPGAVPIPEEQHSGLSRHRKVVQSFNPMTAPLWLLKKEQHFFVSMFEYARRS